MSHGELEYVPSREVRSARVRRRTGVARGYGLVAEDGHGQGTGRDRVARNRIHAPAIRNRLDGGQIEQIIVTRLARIVDFDVTRFRMVPAPLLCLGVD